MGDGYYDFDERYGGKEHRMGKIFDMTGIFKTPNATSMDLDAVHRVDDVYVIVELKKKGTPFKTSERYVYHVIADALNMADKHAYCIEAWYDDDDVNEKGVVNEANAQVQRYYSGYLWHRVDEPTTVKELCKWLFAVNGKDVV